MRSLVSRSMTRVLAAPPADAEGDAPGEPLVPEVPAGPQAAARTSAMAKRIDDRRADMLPSPETSWLSLAPVHGLTPEIHMLTLRSSSRRRVSMLRLGTTRDGGLRLRPGAILGFSWLGAVALAANAPHGI